jgi:demethylmenaquinone methyltransferase/2-methoxy-6-polyprenyl-1,4-benzoquinol methylase
MIDFTSRDEVLAVYRKRARYYDLSANLYYLLGFREQAYRKIAVEALRLKPGDRVVEIGCGTGLNFSLLQEKVGEGGKIIGVDLTDAMLKGAADRIERNGWSNVELVRSDAASFRFPEKIDGVLSTFALTLEPDYDGVIARGAAALKPGRRWVVLDVKLPSNWLRYLAPLLILLVRPFAVSMEVAKRHPWESIETHLTNTTVQELYFGVAYLSAGEAA